MDVWNAIINDFAHCKNEEGNEFGIAAVALIRDNYLKQNVVGYVPIHLSRTFFRFLKLLGCNISATVTSKMINCRAGDELEIPVEYRLFGNKRAVTWLKMQIEKIENHVNNKVNRCMK